MLGSAALASVSLGGIVNTTSSGTTTLAATADPGRGTPRVVFPGSLRNIFEANGM